MITMGSINIVRNYSKQFWKTSTNSAANGIKDAANEKEEFRVFNPRKYPPPMVGGSRRIKHVPAAPPRYLKQKVDQDWGNVWPAARSFHPATVPLPLRMGKPPYSLARKLPQPNKWGNLELKKIPNFLHLTPPIIKKQTEALKQFCTSWPDGLETPELQAKHFPVIVSKSTYVHSTTSIRDERARIVTLKISLKSLNLDHHGRDKLLRLVGERYDPKSNVLTIVADRCPLSDQNEDYVKYLLTVLYNESMKTLPWESEKDVSDGELYVWEGSSSEKAINSLSCYKNQIDISDDLKSLYIESVKEIHNIGENQDSVEKYKDSVVEMLGLKLSPKEVAQP